MEKKAASGKYAVKSFNISMSEFSEDAGDVAISKFRKKAKAYLTDDNTKEMLPEEMHSQIAVVNIVVSK